MQTKGQTNLKINELVKSRGLSLIEIIVAVGVMTLLMSVILYNYTTSNDNLYVSAAAQEVAIAIRQAQAFGLSVKESAVGSGLFTYSFGVYFDSTVGQETTYKIFIDKCGAANNIYDTSVSCGNGTTELVETLTLRNGVKISNICDATNCPPGVAKKLHISFLRPNLDSIIYFTDAANSIVSGPVSTGKIMLTSPRGKTVTINVLYTGQVSIE